MSGSSDTAGRSVKVNGGVDEGSPADRRGGYGVDGRLAEALAAAGVANPGPS
jgi:hypothetical protein